MTVGTLIDHRTEAKELRMAGDLVMSKDEWLERGGQCRGTLGQAHKAGWLTPRSCERIGQPVTPEELANAKDFCIYAACHMESCLVRNGHNVRPCLPVFFRDKCKGNT